MNTAKLKNIYTKTSDFIQKAVYSDLYTGLLCIFAFLMWYLEWSIVGIVVVSLLASVTLFFAKDASAIFLPILAVLTVVRDTSAERYFSLWPLAVIFVLCLGFFLWKNAPRKFRLGTMFLPQLAVSIALIFGGLGTISAQNYLRALPLVSILGIGFLAIYFLGANYVHGDGKVDLPVHFAKICVAVGLIVCAELATVVLQSGKSPSQWLDLYWDVGWGNRNMIATFFPFAFVMSLYLCTREGKFSVLYMVVAFVQFACLLVTLSRGGVLFGCIAFVVALVMAFVKGNRRQLLIALGATIAVALLFCLVFHNKVGDALASLWERFSAIEIRFENGDLIINGTSWRGEEGGLYDKAWQLFKQHPIFGVGIGHVEMVNDVTISKMDWFHSTVMEILASMGIVGVLAYLYYYAMRLKAVFVKSNIKNRFPLFVFISWIAFEGQSLVDVGLLEPIFIFFITFQMIVLEKCRGERYEQPICTLYLLPQSTATIGDGVLPNEKTADDAEPTSEDENS